MRAGDLTMKNLKNLATLSLITAVAGACDVKQDLGDTATTGASSSGTTGTAGTGALDTGPWDDTGIATESGTSSGFADMGGLDTGSSDDTGGETGDPPDMCATAAQLSWDSSDLAPDALGFGGTFVGVGTCGALLGEVLNVPKDDGGGTEASLALTCILSGTRDGTDFVDEAISIDLGFSTLNNVGALLPSFSPSVTARFVVESAGFDQGASRFVVLEQPMLLTDGDAAVLIATGGLSVEPNAATYANWYTGPWFGGPSVTAVDASCSTGDAPECGFDVGVQAGWMDRAPSVGHGGQAFEFLAPTDGGTYDFFIGTAWQAPQSFKCGEDFPSARFDFVGVGTTAS